MAKLSRVLQKIFGSSGGGSEFGQIGSLAAGAPAYSKDLDTIQALTQFLGGLFSLTNSGAQPPRIQDINSLYLLFSSQLKYLFQAGVPEWITTEEYYIGSICQVAGVLYTSKTGTSGSPNVGNAVSSTANWKKTLDIGELSGAGTNWLAALIANLAANVAHVMTTGLGSDWQSLLEAAANSAVLNNDADKVDGQHAADFATATQGAKADTAVQPASISTVARIMSPGDFLIAPPLNPAYVIVTNGSTVTAVTVPQNSSYTVPAGWYAIRMH
jgi:hypothetical protein